MTPIEKYPELARTIGIKDLYFKREDMNPYGSHKGRSIPVMIDHYTGLGNKKFAITGSGNASLAAALYVKELNKNRQELELVIFTGNHIAPHKLAKLDKLTDENIGVLSKERPLQALQQAVSDGYRSLRQSTDDMALVGYESLAEEISSIKNVGAVFIGTSSGTTAQALAQYFLKHSENQPIQVHIVQTSSCHPIADAICYTNEFTKEKSLADAIVDKTALRRPILTSLIKETGGTSWIASNEDIITAQKLTEKHAGLHISPNSALSVIGAMKAAYDHEITGAVVCVICGD